MIVECSERVVESVGRGLRVPLGIRYELLTELLGVLFGPDETNPVGEYGPNKPGRRYSEIDNIDIVCAEFKREVGAECQPLVSMLGISTRVRVEGDRYVDIADLGGITAGKRPEQNTDRHGVVCEDRPDRLADNLLLGGWRRHIVLYSGFEQKDSAVARTIAADRK